MAKLKTDKRTVALQNPQGGNAMQASSKPEKESIWNRDISFSPAISAKDKRQFFQMLAVLLDSGMNILDSFAILTGQLKKKKARDILEEVMANLNEGMSLSDALAKHPKYFSSFEVFSVKMGENSGNVVKVLHDLGMYHDKRIRLQRKFKQALSYPIVVLVIAGLVLSFMIAFVVPMFEDSFKRFNADLPKITRFVLGISSAVRNWGPLLFVMAAAGGYLLYRFRETTALRSLFSNIAMRIPLIGPIVLKIQLSRFCYSLGLMLRSKVNLDQALELLEKVTTFYPLQVTVAEIRKDVVEGSTIYDAFSKHSIFPPVMLQMIKVGERTAKLDSMMDNLGRTLEEEGETGVASLTSLLEPLLIVTLGMIVGVILLSMYLPMFEMTNTVK